MVCELLVAPKCEVCNFKSTNEDSFKTHMNANHHQDTITPNKVENIRKSTRIHCENCEKRFNKIETFQKHMISVHRKPTSPENQNENKSEIGGSNESGITHYSNKNQNSMIIENEDHLGATSLRNEECQNFLIIDKV